VAPAATDGADVSAVSPPPATPVPATESQAGVAADAADTAAAAVTVAIAADDAPSHSAAGAGAVGAPSGRGAAVAAAIAAAVRGGDEAARAREVVLADYAHTAQKLGGRSVPCPVGFDDAMAAGFTPELWWLATHDARTGRRTHWPKGTRLAGAGGGGAAPVCGCYRCAPAGASGAATVK
jgi:hypothetical protein